MLIAERQSRLREVLAKRRILPLDVLSQELRVSPSTVRRDVEALEQQGLVQRTHGGVIWIGDRAAQGVSHDTNTIEVKPTAKRARWVGAV